MMATPAALLARREERQAEQVALLRATGLPLVSLTVVSPGPDKDGPATATAFTQASVALDELLAASGWRGAAGHNCRRVTGPERLVAVMAPAERLKRALVRLEDAHPLGRLWDLDVVTGPGPHGLPVVLGRRELGLPARRCLVCDAGAAGCGRAVAHPLPVVLAARDAVAAGAPVASGRAAADLAVEALLVEARLSPKPGLVDAVSNGSHTDMDLALLERSARALREWLLACWLLGATGLSGDDLRTSLLRVGVQAEAAMRRVTGDVNTHKGALFCLGLALAAHGSLTRASGTAGRPSVAALADEVATLASPLLEAWLTHAASDATHGASAYRTLGLTGARGEAASGFATVRNVSLPAHADRLAETGDPDDALRWALSCLMAANADTNLVARGGPEGLDAVRTWASGVVTRRPTPERLVVELEDADAWFVERNYSPGGSADLLALTWLLHRLCES